MQRPVLNHHPLAANSTVNQAVFNAATYLGFLEQLARRERF
ncbi:MAG: hypothetical protein ACYCO5_12870 [Acidobacteriaceae bacterium]